MKTVKLKYPHAHFVVRVGAVETQIMERVVRRMERGFDNERYVLEISGERTKWPVIDQIYVESCWYMKPEGYVCRTITVRFPANASMEIYAKQTHSYGDSGGVDFDARFISPILAFGEPIPRRIMDFITLMELGAVSEDNLVESIRDLLRSVREHMGFAAKTYISL